MPEETPVTPATPPAPAQPVVQVDESKAMSEMKRKHQEQVRALNTQIDETKNDLADYTTICEELGNPEDPILKVRNLLKELKQLKAENGDLLLAEVQLQVAEKVKVPECRLMVVKEVKAEKPVRKADVATILERVLQRPEVMEMLRLAAQGAMGPNHTRPDTPADNPATEPVIYIP